MGWKRRFIQLRIRNRKDKDLYDRKEARFSLADALEKVFTNTTEEVETVEE